ncbi:MAG: PepSY domain-containing protein [Fimbriimonadaceae bacterium]|nr:PepSY domain-containing protein [Fimbriimonadaceae bacterium]
MPIHAWMITAALAFGPGVGTASDGAREAASGFLALLGLGPVPADARVETDAALGHVMLSSNDWWLVIPTDTMQVFLYHRTDRVTARTHVTTAHPRGTPRVTTEAQARERFVPLARRLGVPADWALTAVRVKPDRPREEGSAWEDTCGSVDLSFEDRPHGLPYLTMHNYAVFEFDPLDGVLLDCTIRRDAKVEPSVRKITKERAREIAIETYGRDAARIPAYVNAAPVVSVREGYAVHQRFGSPVPRRRLNPARLAYTVHFDDGVFDKPMLPTTHITVDAETGEIVWRSYVKPGAYRGG